MSKPLVLILMGSQSDLPAMKPAMEMLTEFGVGYEVRVVSAHRSPRLARESAESAERRGFKVIIAAAGGAAHLAGVVASLTVLPVIGVPMAAGPLNGLDALLSTVQMPTGVPVATVAVGGAANAAILAAQIIATSNNALRAKLRRYKARLAKGVAAASEKVQREMAGPTGR